MLNIDEMKDLRTMMGKNIAILCGRYVYRGKLKRIYQNYLVLEQCCAVEETGKAEGSKTAREDYIKKPIRLFISRIELIFQPKWADAPREEN